MKAPHPVLAKPRALPVTPARSKAMALIVQKYGGTSVGSIDRMRNVAARLKRTRDADSPHERRMILLAGFKVGLLGVELGLLRPEILVQEGPLPDDSGGGAAHGACGA